MAPGRLVLGISPALRGRIEVVAVAILVCLLIFELVRRKRLMERYAILWLLAGVTVLVLGLWQGLLTDVAHAVGIHYAPSALFAITSLFVLVMLVHFSTTVSRLSDQSKALAQRLALLQERLDAAQRAVDRVAPLAEGGHEPPALAEGGHRQPSAAPPLAEGAQEPVAGAPR